ncbi:MAG: hypothetical protein Q9209_002739 [Squamulea sp. 1 TL-2023]
MASSTSEDDAYTQLQIRDHNISDGDVVAAFYSVYSKQPEEAREVQSVYSLDCTRALQAIAVYRQSRILAFVLSVVPHLDRDNIKLLTNALLPPIPTQPHNARQNVREPTVNPVDPNPVPLNHSNTNAALNITANQFGGRQPSAGSQAMDVILGNRLARRHQQEESESLVWDSRDEIWRCVTCQWEVEDNGNDKGQCRCPRSHHFKLSDYPEYETTKSDSSLADSTDSKPNSEDEDFIDDADLSEPESDPSEKIADQVLDPMDLGADT